MPFIYISAIVTTIFVSLTSSYLTLTVLDKNQNVNSVSSDESNEGMVLAVNNERENHENIVEGADYDEETKVSMTPTPSGPDEERPVTNTLTPTRISTVSPVYSITNTPSPTPITTTTPTPALTQIAFSQKTYTSQEINGFIESFAGQYGVDPNVLRHIAICESGFNPNAINLSYAGLYQFSVSAWQNYRREIGEDTNPDLRLDAEEAVQTAAYILSTNRAYIWPNCVP